MVKNSSITASAPGNLMLLGEHAVLHGRRALVSSVNQRLTVTLTPRPDRQVEIRSALGSHETSLDQLEPHPKFRFILAALHTVAHRLERGVTLEVTAEFSDQIGFGSSAAVTVATVAALHALSRGTVEPRTVFLSARDLIRTVQGRGSGADVAASVYGGIVAYRAEPTDLVPIAVSHPFTAVYSGSKLPTPEVIRIVEERRGLAPEKFEDLFNRMDRCAGEAALAVQREDWAAFGTLLDQGQQVMEEMGLSNPALDAILHALRTDPGIQGAKISGSGLGDCAIGLGRPTRPFPFPFLPVEPAPKGLQVT